MSNAEVSLRQISNPQRTEEIRVLGIRFSPNAHVEKIRAEFKRVLSETPKK